VFFGREENDIPFTETIKDGIGIKKVDKIKISKKNIERKSNGVKHL
jgi:hypothetical protein